MNPEKFLLLNGAIVTLLVIYFLMGKKSRPKPTTLNLRKGNFTPVSKEIDIIDEEELNIFFNFNGHLWDAYEVLGIPAGSPMSDVEMAYVKFKNRIDDESKEILEMAYNAIHEKQPK